MINLAALRYRKVFAAQGGPIERVETTDVALEGERRFQSNAFLRADLAPVRRQVRRVYSEAAGSGTHESPLVARFMAISEALERWAYATIALSSDRARYGFEVDPMSNGMAAFPGLYPSQARRTARFEAIERFNLIAWWEGRLAAVTRPTPWPGVTAAVLGHDADAVTVIVHKQTPEGLYAYGHAAAATFAAACRKAVVELGRHEYVVRSFRMKQAVGAGKPLGPTELLERRSLFFSSDDGHEEFRRRLATAPEGAPPERLTAFDGPIPGPWTRYADVWRVVYRPLSQRYLGEGERYFLW